MKLALHFSSALALAMVCTASFIPGSPFLPGTPFSHGSFVRRHSFTPFTSARAAPAPFFARAIGPVVRYTPGKGMTPYLTWYTPTFKCPHTWYCRAEMTVYKRFDGQTEVRAGYSVWNFDSDSAPVPQSAINSIAGTNIHEIVTYVDALSPAIQAGFQGTVCLYFLGDVDNAMQAAIHKLVAECKETVNHVCERDVRVKLC